MDPAKRCFLYKSEHENPRYRFGLPHLSLVLFYPLLDVVHYMKLDAIQNELQKKLQLDKTLLEAVSRDFPS